MNREKFKHSDDLTKIREKLDKQTNVNRIGY